MKYYMLNDRFRREGVPFLIAIDPQCVDQGEDSAMKTMWEQGIYHDISGFISEGDILNQTAFGWVYGQSATQEFYRSEKTLRQRVVGLYYSDLLEDE